VGWDIYSRKVEVEDVLWPKTFLVPKGLVLTSKEAGVDPTGTRPSNWSVHFCADVAVANASSDRKEDRSCILLNE
jgi:hypothetical protein